MRAPRPCSSRRRSCARALGSHGSCCSIALARSSAAASSPPTTKSFVSACTRPRCRPRTAIRGGLQSESCGVLAAAGSPLPLLLAPVVHTDGSGPAGGTLVALRALNGAGAAALGHRRRPLRRRVVGATPHGAIDVARQRARSAGRPDARGRRPAMDLLVHVPAVAGGAPLVLEAVFRHARCMRPRSKLHPERRDHRHPRHRLLRDQHPRATRRPGAAQPGVPAGCQRREAHGGRVAPPGRDLAVLAASVNRLLDTMSSASGRPSAPAKRWPLSEPRRPRRSVRAKRGPSSSAPLPPSRRSSERAQAAALAESTA